MSKILKPFVAGQQANPRTTTSASPSSDALFGNGFGVALVTPFATDGSIDEDNLAQLVQHVVAGGADFLVALGSTGEAAMLTEHERQRVIAIVAQQRGRAKLIVGTGASATAATCTNTLTARDHGADGALIAMPPYVKPTQAGIVAHFQAIVAELPDLPLIAYNVPSRSSVNLTAQTMRELWQLPSIVALKESSGDLKQIARIAAEMPTGRTLLAGDDALLLPTIAVGGHGIVSVAGNAVPHAMCNLLSSAQANDREQTQSRQKALLPLFQALDLEPNPTPIKAALAILGLLNPTPRLPLLTASDATLAALRSALQPTNNLSTHV